MAEDQRDLEVLCCWPLCVLCLRIPVYRAKVKDFEGKRNRALEILSALWFSGVLIPRGGGRIVANGCICRGHKSGLGRQLCKGVNCNLNQKNSVFLDGEEMTFSNMEAPRYRDEEMKLSWRRSGAECAPEHGGVGRGQPHSQMAGRFDSAQMLGSRYLTNHATPP
jgi:hypothetical protein